MLDPTAPRTTPTTAAGLDALADMFTMRTDAMAPADVAPKKPTSRARLSYPEKKDKRANPESMTFQAEHKEDTHGIEVLQPIDSRYCLWAKHDAHTMGMHPHIMHVVPHNTMGVHQRFTHTVWTHGWLCVGGAPHTPR